MVPTTYEMVFWFIMLIVAYGFGIFLFCGKEEDLYVSDYELDRLNGNKY